MGPTELWTSMELRHNSPQVLFSAKGASNEADILDRKRNLETQNSRTANSTNPNPQPQTRKGFQIQASKAPLRSPWQAVLRALGVRGLTEALKGSSMGP